MIILLFAGKGPETSTVSRIVNNGMLINFRENQRGNKKIQSSRTSNIGYIRHRVKTKKAKLTILKAKQMSNTDPTKSRRWTHVLNKRKQIWFLLKQGQIHQIESKVPVSFMGSALNLFLISVTLSYFKIHVFIYILLLIRLENKYSYRIRNGKYT